MKAYTDGARRKSVGACAFVVYADSGKLFHADCYTLERGTNNELEYLALIALLHWANEQQGLATERDQCLYEHFTIYSDSMLVVEQVHGNWQINNSKLKDLRSRAWGLLVRGGHTLEHVKGHAGNKGNEAADRLCNEAMDKWESEHAS